MATKTTAPAPISTVAELEALARQATRAAALACQDWIGRGSPHDADQAATNAMRVVLAAGPGLGTVVVGEGAKDEAPMLFDGERLGAGARSSARRCARRGCPAHSRRSPSPSTARWPRSAPRSTWLWCSTSPGIKT